MEADVTRLLRAWSSGDAEALNALTPLVYEELHRRAHWHMQRENPGHTLQTTALVNEAYLRLVDMRQVSWRDRAHFFALASRVIRHVLVDAARSRRSLKRGADAPPEALNAELLILENPLIDIIALDDALRALSAIDERKTLVLMTLSMTSIREGRSTVRSMIGRRATARRTESGCFPEENLPRGHFSALSQVSLESRAG